MKCNFNSRKMSFAVREAGCPLDHCPCGHHVEESDDEFYVDGELHFCDEVDDQPDFPAGSYEGYYL